MKCGLDIRWERDLCGHGGGSSHTKTVLELIRHCRKLGKWEELQYADLFLSLVRGVDYMKEDCRQESREEKDKGTGIHTQTPPPTPMEVLKRTKPEKVCPLITEVVGVNNDNQDQNGQPVREVLTFLVHRPFSVVELAAWKTSVPPYRQDPEKVTDLCRTIFATQCPTWGEIQTLLNTLIQYEDQLLVIA